MIIASAEVGFSKPDIKIFELALKKAGCIPSNAVMIGDRSDNDTAPAKKLGMKTIWIKRGFYKYYTPETEYEKADFIIKDLNELCCLI